MLNKNKINLSWSALSSLLVLLAAGACMSTESAATATLAFGSPGQLTPYLSPSPSLVSASATPFFTQIAPATLPPFPSPTPFLYTIKAGDTYGGLALRYGSTISAIEAANPGIDPNSLAIGMTVTIPLVGPEVTPTIIPTPAPVAVTLEAPICYANADGSAWCLALARNTLPVAVENLSGWLSLRTARGETPGATAYAPLNLLLPGETIPLMHFFSAPLPEAYTPQIELLTALPAVITTTRYITTSIQIDRTEIDRLQANIDGVLHFEPDAPAAGLVSVVAVAYSEAGQPIGMAKWERSGDPLPMSGVPFQMTVFSLGPMIGRVAVMAEAIPAAASPPIRTESTAPE